VELNFAPMGHEQSPIGGGEARKCDPGLVSCPQRLSDWAYCFSSPILRQLRRSEDYLRLLPDPADRPNSNKLRRFNLSYID
jgi:hypothetical protein